MQWRGTKFIEFWFSSFALISTGESIGVSEWLIYPLLGPYIDMPNAQIVFSAFTRNGGLTTSLVSAALTLLAQLNGIVSVTLPYFLVVIGWVRLS